MSLVSPRERVESVPSSASGLGLTTGLAVCDQRRRRSDLYPQRVVAYMSLDFMGTGESPVESPGEATFGRPHAC